MKHFNNITTVIFMLIIFGTFINATDVPCECSNGYWEKTIDSVTVSTNNYSILPNYNVNTFCSPNSQYSESGKKILDSHLYNDGNDNFLSQQEVDGWLTVTFQNISRQYDCKTCTEPDSPMPVIDASQWQMTDIIQNSCSLDQDPTIQQQCSSLDGQWFSEKKDCCTISYCFKPASQCTAGQDDNGTCIPDIDGDGIPDISDPDIDGDGIPNESDPDIDGDGIPNLEDSYPLGSGNSVPCATGKSWQLNSDASTYSCLPTTSSKCADGEYLRAAGVYNGVYTPELCMSIDSSDSSCPALEHAVTINNETTCMCDTGYHRDSLKGSLCYPDTTSNDDDDPCNYPTTSKGFEFKFNTFNSNNCRDDINLFGGGEGNILINDGCSLYACYYNNTMSTSDNNNSDNTDNSNSNTDTNNSSAMNNDNNSSTTPFDGNGSSYNIDMSPITNKLSDLDTNLGKKLDDLSKKLKKQTGQDLSIGNSLGSKLSTNTKILGDKLDNLGEKIDSIGKNDKGTYGNDFVPGDVNSSSFTINGDRVKKINDDVADIYSKLDNATSLFQSALDQFKTFSDNVTNSFNSLTTDFDSYKTMFSNSPTTVLQSTGTCSGLTIAALGKIVHLDAGMCSSFQVFAPYVNFILTILTQFIIIYLSIKLLSRNS